MSPPPTFHNFDAIHLLVIALTFALPLLLAGIAWHVKSTRYLRLVAGFLALFLVGNYFAYLIHQESTIGLSLARSLPMQLCDWALVATTLALLSGNQCSFELAYFWGLGGTLQAIVTPNLKCGFPSFAYLNFFAIHSGIVVGVLFMIFAIHLRPYPWSLLRVFLWSQVYLAGALVVNALTGSNYGFLSRKPDGASVLDFLTDTQPGYVLEVDALAVLFFIALYMPFAVIDTLGAIADRRQYAAPDD